MAAFPAGSDLNLDGGSFGSTGVLDGPLQVGTLRLRGGAINTPLDVEADVIDLQSGTVGARIVGNTPMDKTTNGTVQMTADQSGYTGAITVHRGTLSLGHGTLNSAPGRALGDGTTTVLPGGRLVNRTGAVNANIALAGGMLDFDMSSTITAGFSGNIDVIADSTFGAARGSSNIGASVNVLPNRTLSIFGPRRVYFSGDLQLDGAISPAAPGEMIDVIANPQPGRTFSGTGTFSGSAQIGFSGAIAPGADGGDAVGALDVASGMWTAKGIYEWQISDADGSAGDGWDLLNLAGSLQLPSFGSAPFVIRIEGLGEDGAEGAVSGFDPHRNHAWVIASAGSLGTVVQSAFVLETNDFTPFNDLAGGTFSLSSSGGDLLLNFTAVPEPSGILMMLAAFSALVTRRRRNPWP